MYILMNMNILNLYCIIVNAIVAIEGMLVIDLLYGVQSGTNVLIVVS